MTEVITEVEEITDRRFMIEMEGDTPPLYPNPEVTIIHKGHIEGWIPPEIEVTADKQG